MLVLAFHLMHGFQSAFRTLGVQHSKYTPLINVVGIVFSIAVPLAFAAMPVYFFLQNN
jgi:succinate dehydrogenase / fumarate reductase cytochrome b subunit